MSDDLRIRLAYAMSNIRRDLDAIDGMPFGTVGKRLDRIAEQVAAVERLLEPPQTPEGEGA